jgi:hypothetical protein
MAHMVQTAIPRHVAQRTTNDCAIAAIAMTANETYEHIAERSPVMIGARGLYDGEVHALLVSATGVPWHAPRSGWLRPIGWFAAAPDPLVALIRRPWKWHTMHWVAVQGGWIHDPEFAWRLRAESYPRRHWPTLSVLRPESSLRLIFVQQYRS